MEPLMYNDSQVCEARTVGNSSSIQGNLERKKQRLEAELKDVNAALDALNANPEVAKLMELVVKAR